MLPNTLIAWKVLRNKYFIHQCMCIKKKTHTHTTQQRNIWWNVPFPSNLMWLIYDFFKNIIMLLHFNYADNWSRLTSKTFYSLSHFLSSKRKRRQEIKQGATFHITKVVLVSITHNILCKKFKILVKSLRMNCYPPGVLEKAQC